MQQNLDRCNRTLNSENYENFSNYTILPYDIFSRLINFQTGFFGANTISYLVRVDVSDQEYTYSTHVQISPFQCNLIKTVNFGQNFDEILPPYDF